MKPWTLLTLSLSVELSKQKRTKINLLPCGNAYTISALLSQGYLNTLFTVSSLGTASFSRILDTIMCLNISLHWLLSDGEFH